MAREDDCETNHGEALAHILNALVDQGRLGELESKAFMNLLVPTVSLCVVVSGSANLDSDNGKRSKS